VAIGEGTTTVVSGTEDPGEASMSRSMEESSVLAPATTNRLGTESSTGSNRLESTLLGKEPMCGHRLLVNRLSEGNGSARLSIESASTRTRQIFCDLLIRNRSTHRRQKIRVPRSNDRSVHRRCCTWKFWQGTLLHRGVSRLRQICNIHSTTLNQCRINQGWRNE
jgi:hypothetical protein